jgi:hypothetical protein
MKPKFMPLLPAIGAEIEGIDITKPHSGHRPSNVACWGISGRSGGTVGTSLPSQEESLGSRSDDRHKTPPSQF